MELLVKVKDAKSVNLDHTRLCFDEKENPLPDGSYNILGFDLVMQVEDSPGIYKMSFDEQADIHLGLNRRLTYYYFNDINGWRDKPHPSVKLVDTYK